MSKPNPTTKIDNELVSIVVKLSSGAFNHGVHSEAKQIQDFEQKLTDMEKEATQALTTLILNTNNEARIDELVHVTVVDGMLMTTLPETGTLHSIGDRMYTFNKEALKDKSKEKS